MKPLLTTIVLLVIPLSAHADLTTAQKVTCAQASIATILGAKFSIEPASIDLSPTTMERFNPLSAAARAIGAQSRSYNVSFVGVDQIGRRMQGKIMMNTGPQPDHWSRNSSTVALQDLTGQTFECSLTKTQFSQSPSRPASREVAPSDFEFNVVK